MELSPCSRVGLDWACSMAEILRSLSSAPLWRDVIAAFTDHCVKQLPFQLRHTNIFTLLVLVGFPQVRSLRRVRGLPWVRGLGGQSTPPGHSTQHTARLSGACTFGRVFSFSYIIGIYSIGVFLRLWDGLFNCIFNSLALPFISQ